MPYLGCPVLYFSNSKQTWQFPENRGPYYKDPKIRYPLIFANSHTEEVGNLYITLASHQTFEPNSQIREARLTSSSWDRVYLTSSFKIGAFIIRIGYGGPSIKAPI